MAALAHFVLEITLPEDSAGFSGSQKAEQLTHLESLLHLSVQLSWDTAYALHFGEAAIDDPTAPRAAPPFASAEALRLGYEMDTHRVAVVAYPSAPLLALCQAHERADLEEVTHRPWFRGLQWMADKLGNGAALRAQRVALSEDYVQGVGTARANGLLHLLEHGVRTLLRHQHAQLLATDPAAAAVFERVQVIASPEREPEPIVAPRRRPKC